MHQDGRQQPQPQSQQPPPPHHHQQHGSSRRHSAGSEAGGGGGGGRSSSAGPLADLELGSTVPFVVAVPVAVAVESPPPPGRVYLAVEDLEDDVLQAREEEGEEELELELDLGLLDEHDDLSFGTLSA